MAKCHCQISVTKVSDISICNTPGHNTVHYNTVLDITQIIVGTQLDYFCYMSINFTLVIYNTVIDWIASTEIGLDRSNNVIRRLRYISNLCYV